MRNNFDDEEGTYSHPVAAALAGGMIAARGEDIPAERAVEVYLEVLREIEKRLDNHARRVGVQPDKQAVQTEVRTTLRRP